MKESMRQRTVFVCTSVLIRWGIERVLGIMLLSINRFSIFNVINVNAETQRNQANVSLSLPLPCHAIPYHFVFIFFSLLSELLLCISLASYVAWFVAHFSLIVRVSVSLDASHLFCRKFTARNGRQPFRWTPPSCTHTHTLIQKWLSIRYARKIAILPVVLLFQFAFSFVSFSGFNGSFSTLCAVSVALAALDGTFLLAYFSKTFWEFKIFDKIQIKETCHCCALHSYLQFGQCYYSLNDVAWFNHLYLLKRMRVQRSELKQTKAKSRSKKCDGYHAILWVFLSSKFNAQSHVMNDDDDDDDGQTKLKNTERKNRMERFVFILSLWNLLINYLKHVRTLQFFFALSTRQIAKKIIWWVCELMLCVCVCASVFLLSFLALFLVFAGICVSVSMLCMYSVASSGHKELGKFAMQTSNSLKCVRSANTRSLFKYV